MTYPAPFTSSTFVDGEQIDNTKLYTRVLSWLNALATFVGTDTGWVTTGVTPLNSSTIVASRLRKRGSTIQVVVTLTLGATISVPSDGNVANTQLATLPTAFWPGTTTGALQSGSSGPLLAAGVDTSGIVTLYAAASGSTLASGTTITLTGTFLD